MALKRRLGIDPANIIDGDARGKRRKDGESHIPPESSSPVADIETSGEVETNSISATPGSLDPHQLREQGLQLWDIVKDARGKEDQDLAYDFMRLPSKRQYADYYLIIKHPVCLEDIKAKLEASQYLSLDAVKQDFDLCFKNARRYNIKESGIYKAAKTLQKLVASEHAKLTGTVEESRADDEIDVVGDDGSVDEGDRKKKKHSLSRSLKNKLNKLCERTDDGGRLLCTPFMEPPDRKLYVDYYKVIKKVMCFDMIYRKLKRKEYTDTAAFASDVELMFSNAIEYNADHSMIWEDAHTLRDQFHKLMTTLPLEYAVPAYSGTASSGKIKLKLPGASLAQKHEQYAGLEATSTSLNLILKLPPTTGGTNPSRATLPSAPLRTENTEIKASSVPTVQSEELPLTAGKPLLTAQPTIPAATSVGSRGVFPVKSASASPAPTTIPPQPAATLPAIQLQSYTPSPAPPELPLKHPIQSVVLQTTPHGRTFYLDREEGVRIWSVRLGVGERAIRLSQLHFVEEVEDTTDGEDGDETDQPGEEESSQNKFRRKGAKDKGKAGKSEPDGEKETDAKTAIPDPIAKLNGILMKSMNASQSTKASEPRASKEWYGELVVGSNTVELRAGEIGEIWKILLERQVH